MGMDLTRAPGWVAPTPQPAEVRGRPQPKSYTGARLAQWIADEAQRVQDAHARAVEDAEERVAKAQADALEEWRKHSLDPMKGRIGLIVVAFGDGEPQAIDCSVDEAAGLAQLREMIRPRGRLTWVAHNGHNFDFPYLQIRALAYGDLELAGAFHQEKPWDGTLVDTLSWWPQVGGRTRYRKGRLESLADHLGIPWEDNPITGGQVLDSYVEGRWDDVIAHGIADVRAMREVYRILAEVRGA